MTIPLSRCHWQGAQAYWGKRRGDQRTDGLSSLSERTANGAISTEKDCAWGSRCLVGLSDFTVVLQQHMGQPILGDFGTIGLDRPPAQECHYQFRRIITLPAANLWQQGSARAAARVGEEQNDRLPKSAQGMQRRRLSGEGRKDKVRSRCADSQPNTPSCRWRSRQTRVSQTSLQRLDPQQ